MKCEHKRKRLSEPDGPLASVTCADCGKRFPPLPNTFGPDREGPSLLRQVARLSGEGVAGVQFDHARRVVCLTCGREFATSRMRIHRRACERKAAV